MYVLRQTGELWLIDAGFIPLAEFLHNLLARWYAWLALPVMGYPLHHFIHRVMNEFPRHICIYRDRVRLNRVCFKDTQTSPFNVLDTVPSQHPVTAGSSVCDLHHLCGRDDCTGAECGDMRQNRLAWLALRFARRSGNVDHGSAVADLPWATNKDIAEPFEMDSYDLACGCCPDCPRVANVQPVENRAYHDSCSRGVRRLLPDARAPFWNRVEKSA